MRIQLLKSENRRDNDNATSLWLKQPRKGKMPTIMSEGAIARHFEGIVRLSGAIVSDEDYEEFRLINPNVHPDSCRKEVSVGKHWHLTSHQLRRTFAVFGKRHNLLSDVAIKQQFKHLYLPMSEWYGEGGVAAKINHIEVDTELQNLINEVDKEVTTQTLHNWYSTDAKLFGKMGKRIEKERKDTANIYSSWDYLYKLVESGRIAIAGTLHSYCLAGYDCRMDKIASPVSCFNCGNVVIDEEKAASWKKRHDWILEAIQQMKNQSGLSQSQLSHFTTQLKAAERVMKYFNIPFVPFKQSLEGVFYE
jgi:hypothetical protein